MEFTKPRLDVWCASLGFARRFSVDASALRVTTGRLQKGRNSIARILVVMSAREFVATAWRGGTYGIRIGAARARFFERSWSEVEVELESWGVIRANLTDTFWTTCPELRNADVGRWLSHHGAATWPRGRPPKILMRHLGGGRFAAALRLQ